MKIAQKPKEELIQTKKEYGRISLTKWKATARNENANAIEAAPATTHNRLSEATLRSFWAVASANAPRLRAMTTNSRATGRPEAQWTSDQRRNCYQPERAEREAV
jgi:hypothetical protein